MHMQLVKTPKQFAADCTDVVVGRDVPQEDRCLESSTQTCLRVVLRRKILQKQNIACEAIPGL